MASSRFEIKTDKDNRYHFNLIAANNEPILRSEGCSAKASCTNGIESVKANAATEERYQRKTASDGRFYFTLVTANDESSVRASGIKPSSLETAALRPSSGKVKR